MDVTEEMYNLSNYDYDYDNFSFNPPCSFNINNDVSRVVGLYVHSIIFILGFVGNSLVIITYMFYKRTKSLTDIYLLNMAIADLLFVLSLPLLVYNEMSSWPMGSVACKLLHGSYSVNLYSGMLLLACISTDRYIAIVQAHRSFRLRSLSYGRIICVAVWAFALLVSVPTFYFYQKYTPGHTVNVMMLDGSNLTAQNLTVQWAVCGFKAATREVAMVAMVAIPSIQLVVGFFLPLLIMVFCYTAVIVTLMKAKNFQRHKAVRVVMAVVVVFVLCHLPYNVALLYDTASMFQTIDCGDVDILQTALTVMQSIAYLQCCLNPVVYAFVGVRFRNHFRRIFQDLCCPESLQSHL
ncbi:C-C chemokine receptor type 6-like [Cololabis saira]|uniref:C-C chemokine receptor type 6-like n=1 Tax=Cololabis saira TaxID=129043 RepID=UPI002AD1F753|nr:C-C chemokine receptor type 6-like [Cololabis saira]